MIKVSSNKKNSAVYIQKLYHGPSRFVIHLESKILVKIIYQEAGYPTYHTKIMLNGIL